MINLLYFKKQDAWCNILKIKICVLVNYYLKKYINPGLHDEYVFCNTGTEANMRAIRLARAYTGKKTIARFHGGWHGGLDGFVDDCNGVPEEFNDLVKEISCKSGNGLRGNRIGNCFESGSRSAPRRIGFAPVLLKAESPQPNKKGRSQVTYWVRLLKKYPYNFYWHRRIMSSENRKNVIILRIRTVRFSKIYC